MRPGRAGRRKIMYAIFINIDVPPGGHPLRHGIAFDGRRQFWNTRELIRVSPIGMQPIRCNYWQNCSTQRNDAPFPHSGNQGISVFQVCGLFLELSRIAIYPNFLRQPTVSELFRIDCGVIRFENLLLIFPAAIDRRPSGCRALWRCPRLARRSPRRAR